MQATFDQISAKNYGKAAGDPNTYSLGVLGGHNVVLAHMPAMGKVRAATVAAGLRSSFNRIRVAFLVGICGAVPFGQDNKNEIILGDVVISETIVQYDLGKQYPTEFKGKQDSQHSSIRLGLEIEGMLAKLQITSNRAKLQSDTLSCLKALQGTLSKAAYPGKEADKLYDASYIHKHRSGKSPCVTCESSAPTFCQSAAETDCDKLGCEAARLVLRQRLLASSKSSGTEIDSSLPQVHLGKIGSADTVMKSAEHRDRIAEELRLIAYEMEGAGMWDQFSNILVLKGVCDYADSHKNKLWQFYAAATAASCLKSLLREWPLIDRVSRAPTQGRWIIEINRNVSFS